MAQEPPKQGIPEEEVPDATYYPGPPPFWKSFTAENFDRLEQLKKDAGVSTEKDFGNAAPSLSAVQLLDLPAELRYLAPPSPPADDNEYRVFNEPAKAQDPELFPSQIGRLVTALNDERQLLPGWKYEQLYQTAPPDADEGTKAEWSLQRQQYLLRFVRSILLNFLELLGILAAHPQSEDRDVKLGHILNLVANMHALINEYRPHQARETLIHMMHDQVDRKRAEIENIRQMKEKVAATLQELAKNAPDRTVDLAPEVAATISAEEKRRNTERCMWYAMDELLGQ